MNSVFMSKRLIFNESRICAFSEFLVSSSFRVSNKLQVSIFQISNKVQNGDFNDFLLFLKSQRSHFFEKRKEVGNGRKLENRKMEGCRNCVFPWRCLCSQSLGSSLVAYSVLFWTSVPLGVPFIFWLLFPVRLLSSRWCLALVSFRRWFAHPLWICRGSSTSCRKASRRPLALLALNKENFAEADYSFHFFLCKVNMIACSVRGDVESRSYIAKHSSLRNFFSPVL